METSFRVLPPYRLLQLSATLAAVLGTTLVLASSPAGAIVTTVGPANVGLQPRSLGIFTSPSAPAEFSNSSGNPILSASKTYAIYWDPTDHYHGDWQNVIDRFFQNMGAAGGSLASVFAVDAQYTDATNQHALYRSTFMGSYTDTDGYPVSQCEDPSPLDAFDRIGPIEAKSHTPVCLTDKQIQEELEQFITQHSLQRGMGSVFYLLTPPGVAVCLDAGGAGGHCSDFVGSIAEIEADEKAKAEAEAKSEAYIEPEGYKSYRRSFCSYHSDISQTSPITGDANTILYGVIPWTAGGLGDGHLTAHDENTPAYACQDGGFDPTSKPIEQREQKKEAKKNEVKEKEEPPTQEEKEKQELKEELEGPHQQEPNQVTCPSQDGFCDVGLADLIVNQIGVEQQNIVTDPLLNAWHDPHENEATDECRNFFAPAAAGSVGAAEGTGAGTLSNQTFAGGSYYLNNAFNLAATKLPYPAITCLPGIRLEPQFTAPNPVNVNEIVGFDGMESDITLNAGDGFTGGVEHPTYASYTWNFGDGSAPITGFAPGAPSANSPGISPCVAPWEAPCAASTFHSYQYGGSYEVTLTVTDVGGNTATVGHVVAVDGPPPPSRTNRPRAVCSPGSGSSSVAGPGAATGGSPLTQELTPPPVVTAFVVSKSLKKVLGSGLAVGYSANEQVAGSLQVLLDGATAKRLGVHGPTATGLPKGSPRSIVIGSQVLVTTKAGRGTVRIRFSPRSNAHLAHTRKLKLTLRLVARNASRQNPQSTTVLSTVVLTH